MRLHRRLLPVAAAVGLIATIAAGCGSSNTKSSSTGGGSPATSGTSDTTGFAKVLSDASDAFVTATGGVTGTKIPLSAIAKIKAIQVPAGAVGPGSKKRKVALICVAPSAGCTRAEDYEMKVLQSFGWDVTKISAEATPQGWQSAFDTAISQHVDAISATSISPSAVSAQLAEAKKAGIVTVDSAQSPELNGGGYDAMIDFRHALGKQLLAMYAINDSGGKAKMVNITLAGIPDLDVKNVQDMVSSTCAGCSFKQVKMTVADAADPVKAGNQITAILNSQPDTNYIIWPTDNVGYDAVVQAIRAAGKSQSVKLLTEDGNPPGIAAVQKGDSPLYGLIPYDWALGLAPVDALLRKLNGGTPIKDSTGYGIGVHLVTKANAPQGKPTYESICKYSLRYVDWISPYEKAWGVKIPRPC